MYNYLLEQIKKWKSSHITIDDLMKWDKGVHTYEEYAKCIIELEELYVLNPIKKHKRNNRQPSLANTYRINKTYLKDKQLENIRRWQLKFHKNICLDYYYSEQEGRFEKDLKWIQLVDAYLRENELPSDRVSSSQRSYEIFQDEKFIDYKGGEGLLKRLNLYKHLGIQTKCDPLMFAVNPSRFGQEVHYHLVVENKTTYNALEEVILHSRCTSLVYGAGWKAVANLGRLSHQLGLHHKEHIIYYFGDLDNEGLAIWIALQEKYKVRIAKEFYRALLGAKCSEVKKKQRIDSENINKFCEALKEDQEHIQSILLENNYIPQEHLNKEALHKIWRTVFHGI